MRKFIALLFLITAPAHAQESPIAKTQLLLHAPEVVKGQSIRAGVLFSLPAGWHIYWQNPGDSGLATSLAWTLPEGIAAGAIQWPTPERIETDGIVNYGYAEKVILPVELTPSRDAIEGEVAVEANWLVCKDICIPESATLRAALPSSAPQAALLLDATVEQLPKTYSAPAQYRVDGENVILSIPAASLPQSDATSAMWFPLEDGVIRNSAAQQVRIDDGTPRMLHITALRGGGDLPAEWHGTLTVADGEDAAPTSYLVTATNDPAARDDTSPATVVGTAETAPSTAPLLLTLLFAFLGGLILNLMPCVLPVLSLKALALAKKSGAQARVARQQGMAYAAGVIASFMVIAAVMIALKIGGAAIGWGFQLQEPAVVAGLAILMLLVALNLLSQFEMPVLFGSTQTNPNSLSGSFLTGALAVALATPCTAPFMAPAIGATLTLAPATTLLVFAALGLGMAAPFLLISFWPRAQRLLPKPGLWMGRFKECLAFPMLATAAWLAWVLVQINGLAGLEKLLLAALAVAWLVWWHHGTPHRSLKKILLLAAAAVVAWGIYTQPAPHMESATREDAFTIEKLDVLRAEGRPVFVDATAAWCLTCKVNERVALHTDETQTLFARKNVAVLVADWTMRDAAITRYLASFGRNGVPLYVYYPPRGEPVVLPQILTPSLVQHAVNH